MCIEDIWLHIWITLFAFFKCVIFLTTHLAFAFGKVDSSHNNFEQAVDLILFKGQEVDDICVHISF